MKNRVLRALWTKGPTARFVVAVAVAGAMAGACDVHSFTGPGTLASLTISPDPTTLAINGTQQYDAVGKDAEGNVVAISPTWSVVANGGDISTTGLFTAGMVPGVFTSTVMAVSGVISATATVTVTTGALASITVTPNPVTLAITGTQQYTAVGKDAGGNVVAITPTWSVVAGGGAITGAGLFTAGTVPGTFTNTVQATSGSISGTATVMVIAGALASITVTPNPVTLAINGTQQYTAVGKDAGGNIVAIAPAWSVVAGGGAINSTGLFTAGTVPGTFTNTVQATSGSISGNATVTVTTGLLATITVTPNPVTLVINGTQQYDAVGRDAGGNVVAISPTWSVVAGGGAITSTGLFTAGTVPGVFSNTVQATSGSISGTATVTVTTGPLATITVTPNPVTLAITGTQQYTAVGRDAGGNVVAIAPTWSAVAGGGAIDGAGLFTAGTLAGTFTNTVQATSGSISGHATVTVIAGALATIAVSPNPITLAINGTQQYAAVGRDAGGNVVTISPTWSVVAGGGAINSTGLFTAGTVAGTFTNTVQASSGSISGTATVTVTTGALASITVTPNPVTLAITGTQQYSAVGRDAGGNVVAIAPSWSVVAGGGAITSAGLFTAGTVPGVFTNTVMAVSGGVSGTATVTVTTGALATIAVTPNPVTLAISGTQQYTAVGKDASGNVVAIAPTWSVVASGGAINSTGLFTAGTVPGTFTNTVQASSGSISGRATVTVIAGGLASITVTPNPVTLAINGTQQYSAVGRDAGGNVVAILPTWSVVAGGGAINSTGLFTAGTVPGTFTNTVRATSGSVSGTATVTVTTGALASITVTPNPVTLVINGTQQYTAVGRDAGGNVVAISPAWSVVAGGGAINSTGLFTAGTALGSFASTVTATVGGIAGAASVTVIAGPVATITVTPNPIILPINATQQFTAVGKDAGGNIVAVSPSWSVTAGGGAINSTGLFTAGTVPGTFTNTVRATSGSISGTATVTVTTGLLASITVTPNPVTLAINGTQQYSAVGRDAGGNVVAISPTWSVVAGGGAIAGTGLFTAGTAPGTFPNTVQATSGSVSGTATVTVTTGALASITVTPNPVTLAITGAQQFTAVGRDAGGNVVAIAPTWSVVAGGGAINSSGLFTAGTVPGVFSNTVQATSGSISGTATVTVTTGPLAAISVTPNPVSLAITGTQQFTAAGTDAGGNIVAISPSWSVTAGGGVINSSGLFTAGTVPGTFTNTVQATSGSISGTATVTVTTGPLATITVTPNPVTLAISGQLQYSAVGRDAGGNVVAIAPTWSVVAGGGTINSSGLFTAGTVPGTFPNTVQASSGSISGNATVTVTTGALASITVTPNPVTLAITGTQQFTAVGKDAGGNVVAISPTWSVVAGGGAITGAGLFTAGTVPGTFTNTVQAGSGSISGTATVTVTTGPLATITVTPNPVTLAITSTQQYTAVGRDAGGNVVAIAPSWSVAAGGGAINSTGLFTAGTVPGTFTNTVQATSGSVSGTATVTVTTGPLATITVTPNPITLAINGTQQYSAVGRDAGGNVVAISPTWSVVAGGGAINSSGLFTAGSAPGTFSNTVRATSGSISGTATVTVTTGPLATITVTPNPFTLPINGTQQYTAVGRDAGGNIVAIAPTWSVVAGGGAISSAGLFTAGTVPGTFTNTVQATSGSTSGRATVTVIAGPLATITVTPNPVTLAINGTQQYTAVGRDAGGNVVAITPTWSVVAVGGSIDGSTGLFTAGTVPGTFTNTVQATSGSIAGNATVTVIAGPLTTITVTPNPVTLAITGTQQYTAVGKDAGGNVVAIAPTWSVVAGGGAINSTGLFTAGTVPGTFTNTVTATSGTVSGHATVTVIAGALVTITVTPNPVTLPINGTQQYTAVGTDAGGNVVAITPTWSVVAGGGAINGTGLFTAGTVPGTFTNTVQATSGVISGRATVTVIAGPLATITVTPNPVTVPANATQQFTAVGTDAGGNVVAITPTWSVVAGGGSINGSTGLFTAGPVLGTFTNTVSATSGGISGFATVTVTMNLGTAASFAVLGGAGASSCTGVSDVKGNVGVDPSGTISGFPTPCVISAPGDGSVHLNDATAAAAQADVTAANTTLSGMTCPGANDLTGQDLGGMTLAPGVYCFTSTAQLTGTLILSGSATDLWVFRIGTTLTTAAGATVSLAGAAQAANVYWQVGTSATLGATNAPFRGTIIATASITLGAGTSLIGRALAKATVIMDTNVITLP